MSTEEFEDIFSDLLPADERTEEPMSIEEMIIDFRRDLKQNFETIGIRNIFIIEFDEVLGPKLKFFASKDDILEKMIANPAFVAEITIFAKYANEVLLKDGRRLVIKEVLVKNKQNYIFIEIGRNFLSPKPLKFARYMKEFLTKTGEISKESIKKAVREASALVFRSTIGNLM
ncbi:MAG: hypothetical protein ACP6IP_09960 [Candidatus Njordarchaeia archaeon]